MWTYQLGSHRIFPPPFCGAYLNFSRKKGSAVPFPRRPQSRILYTNDLIVLHLLRVFLKYILIFFVRRNPSSCDDTEIRTHSHPKVGRCRDYQLNYWGVCVCVFSSHSFWTSSSLNRTSRGHTEGHTGFLIHLLSAVRAIIFLARRIQPFLYLVDREIEFCALTI